MLETKRDLDGVDYPFDLWIILSKYILPEDIGKFAALCRTSAAVLNSMSFWINLYIRFYNISYEDRLPNVLRPLNIRRCICIRMNVIRALYQMYPMFRERSVIVPNIHVHPELLIGRTCVLAWNEIYPLKAIAPHYSKQWRYCFKLKAKSTTSILHQNTSEIWRNPEENCKLLVIISTNFVPIPSSVETLVLAYVALRLTQSLRNYKLELKFESEVTAMSSHRNFTSKRLGENVIVLDPIVSLVVLDWWHPNYPHANIVQSAEDKTIDDPPITWDQ